MTRSIAAAALCAALALSGCGRRGQDASWAAEVDGVRVPAADLERQVDQRMEDDPEAKRDDVVSDILQRLINDQVVMNYAAKRHIDVSAQEVEERLRELHGPTWKDPDPRYRESVRREMIVERTALADLGERARTPESSQRAYFEEHKAEFATPPRVLIRQIVVAERGKADELRAQLEKGADFAELAKADSIAPQAADGGLLPPFAKGELPEAFDRAFELEPGQVSPVIESPYGFHLFRVESKLPAHEASFEEAREKIAVELDERALEDLRREWIRGLRKNAEIKVNDGLLETLR
ncbi:MAG TPA: peptidyl-prolyl cis-trans isomerase [Myxococcota bacterium]|nr:peptidyl-prolyl cis-trans isomerase [Myxococcota bacterium]